MREEVSKANQYAVPSGVHTFEKKWPVEVRVVARLAHIFPFALPSDFVALRELSTAEKLVDLGATIDPWKMVHLFIGHFIKWPTAVRRWRMLVESHTEQATTAAGLVKLLREVILWSSGQDWSEMFNRMHGGRSVRDAQTGLAVLASRLGLVVRTEIVAEPPRGDRRLRGKVSTGAKRQRSTRLLQLGRGLAEYTETESDDDAVEIIATFVKTLQDRGLKWPAQLGDVPSFADALLDIVKATRAFQASSGASLKGGKPTQNGHYNAKHFLRIVLTAIEAVMPQAVSGIPFCRLSDWCPDKGNHADAIDKSWSTDVVQEKFGCSALLWHCWPCLVGFGDESAPKAAPKTDRTVFWEPFLAYEMSQTGADSDFPPGPHVLIASMSEPQ